MQSVRVCVDVSAAPAAAFDMEADYEDEQVGYW